jgi:hypothetical protein
MNSLQAIYNANAGSIHSCQRLKWFKDAFSCDIIPVEILGLELRLDFYAYAQEHVQD